MTASDANYPSRATTTERINPEPVCECGALLRDNWLPHSSRCDICARYRPAPPPYNPPPEAEPCAPTEGRLHYAD